MKKYYQQHSTQFFTLFLLHSMYLLVLLLLITFTSCESNDNFPKDYVGFKQNTLSIDCDQKKKEIEIEIEIIAIKKEKTDREVSLTATGGNFYKLVENRLTIEAEKKSATLHLKIYPQQLVLKEQNIQIVCTPKWKDGKASSISIKLKKK